MIHSLCIGPVSENSDTSMKLKFGNNVSASNIIAFVQRNAEEMRKCGLITKEEARKMLEEVEQKVERLQ